MNTPISWIKDYVPELDCTDKEYYDRMTLSGTKVENWKNLDHNCEKIVVGRVEAMEKHPDADHLWVCRVNIGAAYAENGYNEENDGLSAHGEETKNCIQIVTGAQNLKLSDLVPTCLNGGKVAGGHDGSPLPTFAGAPKAVCVDNDLKAWAASLWEALDGSNRISLFARFIDLETKTSETEVINRYGR